MPTRHVHSHLITLFAKNSFTKQIIRIGIIQGWDTLFLTISTISTISTFVASPLISTIISIPLIASTRTVEKKSQPSTKVSNKNKGKEEDIDLDEDIVIPNWDISTLNPDQMNIMSELLQKRAKHHKLREEKNRETQVLEDVKNIFVDALSTEVDSTKPILDN